MASHFLLSAARTLSLKAIYKAGEDAAYDTFRRLRWPETDGEAVCPKCGSRSHYNISTEERARVLRARCRAGSTAGKAGVFDRQRLQAPRTFAGHA